MLRELVQTFILCLVCLLALIIIGRGLNMRELLLGLDLGIVDTVRLFLFLTPMFLLMVVPISCMLSVFLTFLRMSTDRELIALRAGGVSVYQMLAAPLIFSLACMLLALFISLHGISWGMGSFRSSVLELANTRAKVVVQPGVFNQDIFGLTLFARKVDPVTGELKGVVFEDRTRGVEKDNGKAPAGQEDDSSSITILAPSGSIETDESRGELVFTLHDGRIYRLDKDQFSILNFEEYAVRLDLSTVFKDVELGDIRPKEMSWEDLTRMDTRQNAPNERFQRKVGVEWHKRLALPVAALVLGVFSIPLACAFEGVKRQLGVVLSLLMFLVYYSFFSVGLSLGESGILPAAVGLWAANVLFACAAVFGLRLTARERAPAVGVLVHALHNRFKKRRAARTRT